MSLFGAMNTAVSGLNAQSAAFSNISDNVANSQTVGYKGTNTSFVDYLTSSSATQNQSGSVATRPDYTNDVQGTIQQSTDPTAMAISGNGFFAVGLASGTSNSGVPQVQAATEYTRAGDFQVDKNGFLVNSAGEYLKGWAADPTTGVIAGGQPTTLQISTAPSPPVATSNVTLSANLPAGGTPSGTSQVQVYDAQGATHALTTNWTNTGTNTWTLQVQEDGNPVGNATATFNTNGTLASLDTGGGPSSSNPATVGLSGAASGITLNLGTFGSTSGVTQDAATNYTTGSITQDGLAAGNYTGITIQSSGNVVANYDNGQTRTLAQIPIVTFADADALQRQNGQAFTATSASGAALTQADNSGAAGGLVVGSTESSNVDIASELSKLIVAQQAYGANAKMITAANQMLQTTIDMKQ